MTEQKKTLAEIAEEIKSTRAKIEGIKDEIEKSENAFFALDENTRNKYIFDTPKADRIMRKWEEQRAEVKRLENLKKILQNNYYFTLFENLCPTLISVLKKYNGKRAGERTIEKMQNEIKEAAGVRVYFKRNTFTLKCETLEIYAPDINITIYTKYRKPIIFEDNTINGEILADDLCIYGYFEYIENPTQRLEEIEEARATVEEIKKQYNNAAEKYNNLLVDGFEKVEEIYK